MPHAFKMNLYPNVMGRCSLTSEMSFLSSCLNKFLKAFGRGVKTKCHDHFQTCASRTATTFKAKCPCSQRHICPAFALRIVEAAIVGVMNVQSYPLNVFFFSFVRSNIQPAMEIWY